MARAPRQDFPGAWHHVVNRGIARRPLFERRDDIRFFLSRLAKEVRRGRLEVHAWCALTTHFHLLVRSPTGELSEAMRRAENEYSRYFNRNHGRDGTLIRGRFLSRPVTSLSYKRAVIRYIDANPVGAGLVTEGWQYPWCSAGCYVRNEHPSWLERSWVEAEVAASSEQGCFSPENYLAAFGSCGDGTERLIQERMRCGYVGRDDLDDLVGAAPERVRNWLLRKTKLADGHTPSQPVCDGPTITATVRQALGREKLNARVQGQLRSAASIATIGLLRNMAAMTWIQISIRCGIPQSKCQREFILHEMSMHQDPVYSKRIAEIGAAAIANCLGPGSPHARRTSKPPTGRIIDPLRHPRTIDQPSTVLRPGPERLVSELV